MLRERVTNTVSDRPNNESAYLVWVLCPKRVTFASVGLSGESRATQLYPCVSTSQEVGVVVGAGGMGKSRALDDLSALSHDRSLTVSQVAAPSLGELAELLDEPDMDLLLVDDAHLLSEDAANRLATIALDRRRPFSMVVATRPTKDVPSVGRLLELAERRGHLCELGPYSDHELAKVVVSTLGVKPTGGLLSAAKDQSLGHPLVLDRLLSGWLEDDCVENGRFEREPTTDVASVRQAFLGTIAQLNATERAQLGAYAISALHPEQPPPLEQDLATLSSHGLIVGDGQMPPAIARSALAVLDANEVAEGQQMLLDAFLLSGADPVAVATRFDEVRPIHELATGAWIDAGDWLLSKDPISATDWYQKAHKVSPTRETLGRIAVAHSASGQEAASNDAITEMLQLDANEPRTLGATAQLAARHGRWTEAGELLSAIDKHPRWSESMCGHMSALCFAIADRPVPATPATAREPLALAMQSCTSALRLSLSPIPDTVRMTEQIRQLATRVIGVQHASDQPVSPIAVGAMVALSAGELDIAELLLSSDDSAQSSALLRWLKVRTGTATVNKDQRPRQADQSPYTELFELATSSLIARRTGDVAAGIAVLESLRKVVALAPIDVMTLDPAAELLILATRFGSRTIQKILKGRIEDFLQARSYPPLWTARIRWAELEAAVATRNINAAQTACNALKGLGPIGSKLEPLVDAAATWVLVLDERCSASIASATARDLTQAGYRNEAAVLLGQAAIRLEDADDAKTLLNHARELRAEVVATLQHAPSPSGLSDREIEVGELILEGHSYKEIGSRLFISAKTVEHHASHIRRKLGTVGAPRAAFLAALRGDLDR